MTNQQSQYKIGFFSRIAKKQALLHLDRLIVSSAFNVLPLFYEINLLVPTLKWYKLSLNIAINKSTYSAKTLIVLKSLFSLDTV